MLEDTDGYHSASKLISNHSWRKHGLKNYEVYIWDVAKVSQERRHFNSLPLSSILSPLTVCQNPEDTASASLSRIKLKAKLILGFISCFL